MVDLDWSKYDPEGKGLMVDPGVHHVEVVKTELLTSRKGHPMLKVELQRVSDQARVCWDYLMLDGDGAGIGYAKLVALGLEGAKHVMPADLDGRRAWVYVAENIYQDKVTLEEKRGLKVDIGHGPHCGYWPDGAPPLEYDPGDDRSDDIGMEVPF